jgi:hypothetical protein
MLDISFGMEGEIPHCRRGPVEPVVLDEPAQLRPRDRRLGGLERVHDRGSLERLVARPRPDALRRLRGRLAVERRVERAGEVVPEIDVRELLGGVLVRAAGRSRVSEGDDGSAVLTRVEAELLAGQLAALPAPVEGVLQDIPALARLVQPLEEFHQFASRSSRPRRAMLPPRAARDCRP